MKKEVIEKLTILVTAAFGWVAAVAWNDAIKSLFAENGPLHLLAKGGVWVYAVVVTILAVFVTVWTGRLAAKANEKVKE